MGKTEKRVLAGVMVIGLVIAVWLIWQGRRDKTIISSESVGIAQTAQFMPSVLRNGSRTQITTDKGTFLAIGTFQLIKGNELFIEKRASGKRYVCDYKDSGCIALQ